MTLEEFIKAAMPGSDYPFLDVKLRKLKKGENLCNTGDIDQNIYFVMSGIIEAGMFAKNNEEKIIEFVFPQQFSASFTSMLTQKPSDVYLTCLTDCTVQVINFQKIKEAAKTSLIASQFYTMCLENAYLQRVKKEKDFLILSAEERYFKLIKTRPEIVKQIPVFRVAKYLGIHPDSLSRIRKNLQQGGE